MCDYCGKIIAKTIPVHHPEFGLIDVCYSCMEYIHEEAGFPRMKFKSQATMQDNLRSLYYNKPEKVYTGYANA